MIRSLPPGIEVLALHGARSQPSLIGRTHSPDAGWEKYLAPLKPNRSWDAQIGLNTVRPRTKLG